MNTLRNMKIASKIVSILVLATIALLAVGGVGYYFMKQMNQMATEMYEVRMAKVNYLNDMRRLSRSNEAATYEIFLANNPTAQRAALDESRKQAEDLDKIWANYKKMSLDSYEKERETKYEQILAQYRQLRQQAVDMAQAGQSAAGNQARAAADAGGGARVAAARSANGVYDSGGGAGNKGAD